MQQPSQAYYFKWIARIAMLVVLLYLYPYFSSIFTLKQFTLDFGGDGSFEVALSASIFFAIVSSVGIVITSLVIAIRISPIRIDSHIGKLLALLMIPCLIGSVGTGFIWKLTIADHSFFFKNSFTSFLALLFIQFWQYGTLFIYLFWLNLQSIDKNRLHYSSAIRLTWKERVKDLLLPECLNTFLLLLGLQFLFSFYEKSKLEFIFRSSRGAGTELIAQWLQRNYESDSLIDTSYAFGHMAPSSLIALACIIYTIIMALLYADGKYSRFISRNPGHSRNTKIQLHYPIAMMCLAFIILPIVYVTFRYYHYVPHSVIPLLYTLGYSLLGAFFATLFSISFSIVARLGWPDKLNRFNRRALSFLILILSIQLIPPVVLLASGYEWMRSIANTSSFNRSLLWILGQSLVSFPLLAGFSMFTHFSIDNRKLAYLNSQYATISEIIKTLFLGPLKGYYALTFLIAFSLIWNEHVVNSILSDTVPSFTSRLQQVITGRLTDYAAGLEYLFISLLLSVLTVAIWNYLINKKELA
jgi:ABC-type sugar transport system permease subunit